ncbi:hypothetical protein PFICI_06467 [Pestalotiopsis fici W106-1]|uniref:D-lactate dehydrogenase (cytochrome) n=1 Tax=Pestalotiopsis fici (strain W106-1 / CGMCC3.15140) TaxID=1229662 RepID=W3X5Y5_PESFW|nr:uncharacterized protein PFICI_06467 [Pestalotiopsis fici W106-1]ETS81465.1 hypothetical protein PFICI_06467 [Pestalotiopsis fici W106-1]
MFRTASFSVRKAVSRVRPRISEPFWSPASRVQWRLASLHVKRAGGRSLLPGVALGVAGLGVGGLIVASMTMVKPDVIEYANRDTMLKAAREIETLLGKDGISYDESVIEAHGYSDWSTSNSTGRPIAIVYPETTEQVSSIAKICHHYDTPMIPFGAGSSVEGNFSSPYSGICVDFVNMDKVIEFHPNDMDVVVQPGVNWMNLNQQIKDSGLFLPLDPSPTASIGGMVSTNCSGTNAFRYGTMKDWVINLTVVLADGQIIRTRHRPRKTSAGYNLTSLFVGAEGTLGFVTEITVKLAVIPQDTSVAIVSFPTIKEAAEAATGIIRSGLQLAALELMDEVQMSVLNKHGSEAVRKRRWDENPTLFMKFSGTTAAIASDISRVETIVKPFNAGQFFFAKTKQDEVDLWSGRKEALWTMVSIKPEGFNLWSTDVAVPISRLAEIINASKENASTLGLFNSIVGHVGDGNFHQAIMYDPKNESQTNSVAACVHKMMDLAIEMEGTVSGEHAIGLGKKACLVDELGLDTINLMKTIKKAVDPKWLMNPGKVFDLPKNAKALAAP